MKLESYAGKPILSPNSMQSWESLVVCHPGVICDQGTFYQRYQNGCGDKFIGVSTADFDQLANYVLQLPA